MDADTRLDVDRAEPLESGEEKPSLALTKPDCLDPRNHQRFPVLFFSYSHKSSHFPYPCTPLLSINWNFYDDYYREIGSDRSLGAFLENFAFGEHNCNTNKDEINCTVPSLDHVMRFLHDKGPF